MRIFLLSLVIFLISGTIFAGDNLVPNPDAEHIDDFYAWFHSGGAYEAADNSPNASGDECFAIPQSNDIRTEKFAVTSGGLLDFSYDHKATGTTQGYIYTFLRFWDSRQQFIGQAGGQLMPATSWTTFSISNVEVPLGATLADVAFFPGHENGGSSNSFTGEFFFDEIGVYQKEIVILELNAVPTDNSEKQPLHITLQWDQQPDANSYHLFLGTDRNTITNADTSSAEFIAQIPDRPTMVKYALTLKPYRDYYWRVDTIRTHSEPVEGIVYKFTTAFDLVEDVQNANVYRYGAQDSEGQSLDGLKVIENPNGGYLGVYHSYIYKPALGASEFDLRLATSTDLMNWTCALTLIENADMPALAYHPETGGFFLTHEQWGNHPSRSPSNLGFKYYPSINALLSGQYSHSYIAPFSTSFNNTNLEGTPNFYSISPDGNTIAVGFHYFDDPDLIAIGTLSNFLAGTPLWIAQPETVKVQQLQAKGIAGNIGDRDFGRLFGQDYTMQEAQFVKNAWDTWRGWIYDHEMGDYFQIHPETHGGTLNFGNMTFSQLTSPSGKPAVFCSYFIFGEGAAPGEGGELLFYNELNTKAGSPWPSNGLTQVSVDIEKITWLSGAGTSYSDVFLGSNAAEVYYAENGADTHLGQFTTPELIPPDLQCYTKYYWRVDEVSIDGYTTRGQLWSFTTSTFSTDLTDDCVVDLHDLAIISQKWISIDNPLCQGDISGDCMVDSLDLKMLTQDWLFSKNVPE